MSDSLRHHRQEPTRLPRPWDSPGKNTGVGCNFLLQCIKVKSESEVAQSCPTLSDPMDCSPSSSSIHGIFQARVLEWGAIAFSGIKDKLFLFKFFISFMRQRACILWLIYPVGHHYFDSWFRQPIWEKWIHTMWKTVIPLNGGRDIRKVTFCRKGVKELGFELSLHIQHTIYSYNLWSELSWALRLWWIFGIYVNT